MPVIGEIAAFAFDDNNKDSKVRMADELRKQGWVACEGQSVARVVGPNGLPKLFEVIGSAWGTDDPNAFNIPDLRGQFLRGWAHGGKADPDAGSREKLLEGGTEKNKVGSAQGHAFASHNHGIKGGSPFGMVGNDHDIAVQHPAASQDRGQSKLFEGGSETRPRNVYVMFCIFTGHAPLPPKVNFFAP